MNTHSLLLPLLLVLSFLSGNAQNFTIERDINRQPVSDNKVVFEMFYESHCSGCHDFITQQLKPLLAVKDIYKYVDFQLVPFGHGTGQKMGNRYHFKCQHGESQCQGNIIMTCALNKLEKSKALNFIVCLQESGKEWNRDGANCSAKLGIDWKQIKKCSNSLQGRNWQYMNGLRTKNVKPEYVPAFYVNGMYSEYITNQLFKDALNVICSAADLDQPAFEACNKYWKDDGK